MFTKLFFNGLGGLEQVAIFSSEVTKPNETLPRSVLTAAPIILCIYVLGSSAILLQKHGASADVVSPMPQLVDTLLKGSSHSYSGLLLAAFTGVSVVQAMIAVGELSRLPTSMGWADQLPKVLTELHPVYGTPTKTIMLVGFMLMTVGSLFALTQGHQDGFQAITSTAMLSYGVCYIFLFSMPLLRNARFEAPFCPLVRGLAGLGLLSTAASIVFQPLAGIPVPSKSLFCVSVLGLYAVLLAIGMFLRLFLRKRGLSPTSVG